MQRWASAPKAATPATEPTASTVQNTNPAPKYAISTKRNCITRRKGSGTDESPCPCPSGRVFRTAPSYVPDAPGPILWFSGHRDIMTGQNLCRFRQTSLFTVAPEGCAFRLSALTGIGACHLNLLRMALAGLVIGTGRRVAANLRRLAGNVVRIAGPVIFPFTEAFTAGLIRHSGITAAHMDIVLATAVVLIIRTVYNRTV